MIDPAYVDGIAKIATSLIGAAAVIAAALITKKGKATASGGSVGPSEGTAQPDQTSEPSTMKANKLYLFVLAVPLLSWAAVSAIAQPAVSFQGLTAVDASACIKSDCPSPSGRKAWAMTPSEPLTAYGSTATHPNGGLLGVIVQHVVVDYTICGCQEIPCPDGDTQINLTGCVDTHHEHFEMMFARQAAKTRTDRIEVPGQGAASFGKIAITSKFVPWDSPAFATLMQGDWTGGGSAQQVPPNPSLPSNMPSVHVGSMAWSHSTPAGWGDDFGGTAQTGGDHSVTVNWICCDPVSSTVVTCAP